MFGEGSLFTSASAKKIAGLCVFIGFLSFKPSEPYLSQYLICNVKSATESCASFTIESDCLSAIIGTQRDDGYGTGQCSWVVQNANSAGSCVPRSCSTYPVGGSTASYANPIKCSHVNYCSIKNGACADEVCYKNFSENEVNNSIYPCSTYAYLPALLLLCPLAELVSYRLAILVGIAGRVITRFLLLFGTSLISMQFMQVTYSIGTAAEDIFYAYIFYAIEPRLFQIALSTCRASALVSCLVASILGDLLVTQGNVPLTSLQIISCVAVCCGALLGFFVILPSEKTRQFVECGGVPLAVAGSDASAGSKQPSAKDVALGSFVLTTSNTSGTLATSGNDDNWREWKRGVGGAAGGAAGGAGGGDGGRAPPLSAREVWYQKSQVFLAQAAFFKDTLMNSPNLQNQVAYWVVANATFTEIFGYEVAVFEQLNGGSNNWNGSVLSVMLLLGAVGAMLPVFLKIDAPGQYSAHDVNGIVALAGVLGSVFLLVFVYVWKAIASLAMLSLFIACWQFISVIILVQVASELKAHHDRTYSTATSTSRDLEFSSVAAVVTNPTVDDDGRDTKGLAPGGDNNSSSSSSSVSVATTAHPEAEPPSYAIAIVSLVGISVVLQNLTVSIVFSGLNLTLATSLKVPCFLFAISTFCFACASIRRQMQRR